MASDVEILTTRLDRIEGSQISSSDRLARIETKMDMYLTGHADHESRIRSLEKARWLLVGAGTIGGGLMGELVSRLTS